MFTELHKIATVSLGYHIWLRKAFNTIYAPFLFDNAALADQRLNSIAPNDGVEWKALAAAITSSLFAYSLEINGGASMGAGALEAPTKKLRDYPILDVTQLKTPAKKKLISLAEAVWKQESPVDWGTDKWTPSRHLRDLDEWVLKTAGSSVTVSQLYEDLHATCTARIVVADDKKRKTKKRQSDSIGNVAESIVQSIEPKLKTKNFPDDFADGATLDLPLLFDRNSLGSITIGHLLDSYDIEVHTKTGAVAYSGTHTRPVAEAIVRALLLGRSTFSVSTDRKAMDGAVNRFLSWVAQTDQDIDAAINESALGTGYEDALKKEIYIRLGIHPLTGAHVLPVVINL